MANIVRVPITNVYLGGDYSGRILVGPKKQPMNVILDTGSSALALDGHKYSPDTAGGDQSTDLAQYDSYGDGSSWTGAVINSSVSIGDGAATATVTKANVAVAYEQSANMFRQADGILGLAYAPLDDAYTMPGNTLSNRYLGTQVSRGKKTTITPYLTQLAGGGVVSDKVSFYTRRSFTNMGAGGATDPLNQGWMVVGGGEESTDLYTGAFQTVKVLADDWYNTNLKAVIVGNTPPIPVRARGQNGMPSNSIVDSGTNSLNLGPQLWRSILSQFSASQQSLLNLSISEQKLVPITDLNLATWPDLTFVLQGDAADVSLRVAPGDYWQTNAPKAGAAMAAITMGSEGLAILGLPLMNGYFTIFDGEADNGRGVIKFAASKR